MAGERQYGADTEEDELDPRPSRSEAKRWRVSTEQLLTRLAQDLIELSPRRLELLELPEAVLDAVLDAQTIKSAAALDRQRRIVRRQLRESAAWQSIRTRVDALLRHGSLRAESAEQSEAETWVVRLLAEGDAALAALLEQYPSADRRHLRQLVLAALRAPSPEARRKAEARVLRAVETTARLMR